MASAVNSVGNSSASDSSSASSMLGATAPSEEMFLQLLVAQLQNQDPLNPTDSTQFVSQLAQFTELEQVMALRSDADTLVADAATASSSASNTNTSNTGQTSTANQTN
jgi:flagellar basal-body rod modification protein FlgD